MPVTLYEGDCLKVLPTLPENSIDGVVCDPPYHLTQVSRGGSPRVIDLKTPYGRTRIGDRGFMGLVWDGGDDAFQPDTWAHILRVLKPGGHLLAFGGTRTFHRMAIAIEEGGFEFRDTLMWVYSSGFPKGHDVAKAIKKAVPDNSNDAWQGWNVALKPAYEPIILARKPLSEKNVADNVLKYGTGALNIDDCRVDAKGRPLRVGDYKKTADNVYEGRQDGSLMGGSKAIGETDLGRWPANLIHDGSDEVMEVFASFGDKTDSGSVARFFKACPYDEEEEAYRIHYCSKATKADRHGSKHPTVKPISLMRYLCKLITPPGGVVLDPFAGSGTTGQGAVDAGFDAILIEREPTYANDIRRRLALFMEHDIK